jgi:hypothetical protein
MLPAAGDWPGRMPNGPGTLPFFGLNNHLPFFIGYINEDKDTQSVRIPSIRKRFSTANTRRQPTGPQPAGMKRRIRPAKKK